jgi:hypothetical protein
MTGRERDGYQEAVSAVERSESAEELGERLELVARAQAWAILHLADVVTGLAEALGGGGR